MKKISKAVVTGGCGFIGSHIVDELLKRRIETFVIDNLSTGTMDNLQHQKNNKLLHVIIGDARKIGQLLGNASNIDVIFHEAAIVSVTQSMSDPMKVHDVNVNMTLEIMNYCVSKKIKRFVFASSGAVYGVIPGRPVTEDLVCKPISPYGASKLAVEDYLHAYHDSYGLEPVILRYFNVFGPRQRLNDYSGVITIFINKLLGKESPTIFGDGEQTRNFVHISDVVQANMLAMESDKAVGEMFNVASESSIRILDLLMMLKEITHTVNLPHKFEPPRPGDVKFGVTSINKISSMLGYKPSITIKKGLSGVVDFLKSRKEDEMIQTPER
jgi:nucleoside-diphosphate-sugar epimerase